VKWSRVNASAELPAWSTVAGTSPVTLAASGPQKFFRLVVRSDSMADALPPARVARTPAIVVGGSHEAGHQSRNAPPESASRVRELVDSGSRLLNAVAGFVDAVSRFVVHRLGIDVYPLGFLDAAHGFDGEVVRSVGAGQGSAFAGSRLAITLS
jgi:hypothetical protein